MSAAVLRPCGYSSCDAQCCTVLECTCCARADQALDPWITIRCEPVTSPNTQPNVTSIYFTRHSHAFCILGCDWQHCNIVTSFVFGSARIVSNNCNHHYYYMYMYLHVDVACIVKLIKIDNSPLCYMFSITETA